MNQQEIDAENWRKVSGIGRIVQNIRIDPPSIASPDKEFYPMVDVDLPDKGVYVYWKGLERPTKTFPYKETVEQVDDMKKVIMASVRSFAAIFKNNPIKALLLLIFFRKEIENTALDMLAEFHVRLREVRNKDRKYSKAVREIHRVFGTMGKPTKKVQHYEKIRDIACMILEYDDAYRYRFQDVIMNLKKENLTNPVKEIGRLLDILSEKEGDETVMKPKWKKMKKMLLILRFKKDLREKVRDFLMELNLDELKLDIADQYHASKKPNFKWNFL